MAKRPPKRQVRHSPKQRPTKVVRNRRLTKAEALADRAVREKYRDRPSLDSLLASGDYTAPVPTGDYVGLLKVMARLKRARTSQKVSLSEMAARTGIDKGSLSKLENGVFDNPTVATIQRYAQAIGKQIVVGIVDAQLPFGESGTPATS